jgi:hypothetical protein
MSTHSRDGEPTDALTRALRDAVPAAARGRRGLAGASGPHYGRGRAGAGGTGRRGARAGAGATRAGLVAAAGRMVAPRHTAGRRGDRRAHDRRGRRAVRAAAPSPADVNGFVTIEEELASGVAAGARSILAGLDADAMLDVALFYDGEDW